MFKRLLVICSLSIFSMGYVSAQHHEEGHETIHEEMEELHEEIQHDEESFNMGSMIMHHILDEHGWEFAHGVKLPLPVILYSKEHGLDII